LGTDPANLEAMRWVRSYTEEYGVEAIKVFTSGFGSFSSPQAAFFSGRVAMVLQGVWLNNYINQYAPGMDYGAAPWPRATDHEHPYTVVEADMLVIPRGARHPKEAWEFIKYVNSHNQQARSREELTGMELLCYLQEKNSPMREWSPFFTEQHPHPYINVFRELAESPRADHAPQIGVWQEYQRELGNMIERIRLLRTTPEEGLSYAHARMEASWRRHRASLERQEEAIARRSQRSGVERTAQAEEVTP
jgi:multiple sugar transport system substrate-binding protein